MSTLDSNKRNVWAECLFVDPVADIAVLGSPDVQVLYEQAKAYDALTEDAPALPIGKARSGKGWLLALDQPRWIPTSLHVFSGIYGTSLQTGPTEAGMSGSPVLNDRWQAVGVIVIGAETMRASSKHRINEKCGPQPILTRNLPAWLLLR